MKTPRKTTRMQDKRTNTRRCTTLLVLLALFLLPTNVWSGGDGKTVDALGHVVDGDYLEVPWGKIQLGAIHIAGYSLPITRHTVMLWIGSSLLLMLALVATSRRAIVPKGLYNGFESFVVFMRDELAIPNIGKKEGPAYTPYLLTVFFFILTLNLLGLVPFGATATANINVTFTLACLTFLLMLVSGMRAHGVIKFWINLVPAGVPWWLWPAMLVVELMGLLSKPFALTIRLFANMLAGHMVILSLLGLIFIFAGTFGAAAGYGVVPVSIGFSLFVYLLELLVALIQAYIFTFLTALFIGMSVHSH